jgi:glycosyltransferase involved in cell wall biosynthesis
MTGNSENKNPLPSVSVIIPTYNDNVRLELCLKLLAVQSYPSELIEVIVVDNGSEIKPDFISDIYPGVKLLVEHKKGSYAARNAGLKVASGEVLAFTDSDCQPTQDWLKNGVAALLRADEDIVVGGPVDLVFYEPDNPNTCELMETIFGFRQEVNIAVTHYTVTANLFTWRRVFDDVGVFNGKLASGGDQEWGRRAYTAGYEIVYDENIIINHPSRHEFKEVLIKRKRITLGLCDLAKGNNSYKLRLLVKLVKIFPSVRYRILPVLRADHLSLSEKSRVCNLISVLHFYEYWHCLIHAHYLFYFLGKETDNE